MKQSLPWNITGIPSEAREAARAAASREGVTVGDWLTRRILAEQPAMAAVEARTGPGEAATDMIQRAMRAESAPDTGMRRIDEMLRTMARRLESLERIQTDAQLALNETASEIKTAAREQADSLQRLAERIERLERQSDSGATRDAVRGLHQGLSRLADQIAHTTDGMTGQIAALAEHVARTKEDLSRLGPAEARLTELEERLGPAEGRTGAPHLEESVALFEQWGRSTENRLRELLDGHFESVRRAVEAVSSRLDLAESRAAESGDLRADLAALKRRMKTAEDKSLEQSRALEAHRAGAVVHDGTPAAAVVESEPSAVSEPQPPTPGDGEVPAARPLAAFDEPVRNLSPASPLNTVTPLPEAFGGQLSADSDLQDLLAEEVVSTGSDSPASLASTRRTIAADGRLAGQITIAMLIVVAIVTGFVLTRTFLGSSRVATAPGAAPAAGFQTAFGPLLKSPAGTAKTAPTPAVPSLAGSGNDQSDTAAASGLPQRVKQLADAGDPKAALALGIAYAEGRSVPRDETAAAQWLRKAAQSGEAVAQYRLGTLYEKGLGVPADLREAVAWYAQAAKGGNRKAMHNLAVAYANGAGVAKNYAEAARWFRAAADLGLVDSQFNLAVVYERGLGVTASLSDAYKWYAIAAASGDAESQVRVEALAAQLQPGVKATADAAAKAFRAEAMNRAANEPPELTQIAAQ